MVSTPLDVVVVNGGGVNDPRPTALKVAASVKWPSPAYSVRISVGDRTWNRAFPAVTVCRAGPAAAGFATVTTAAATARTLARWRVFAVLGRTAELRSGRGPSHFYNVGKGRFRSEHSGPPDVQTS